MLTACFSFQKAATITSPSPERDILSCPLRWDRTDNSSETSRVCCVGLYTRDSLLCGVTLYSVPLSTYSRPSILPVLEMRSLKSPQSPLIRTRRWASVIQCPTLSWQMAQTAPGGLRALVALAATLWSRPMTLPLLRPLWTLDLKAWSSWTLGQWVRLEGGACWALLHWWVTPTQDVYKCFWIQLIVINILLCINICRKWGILLVHISLVHPPWPSMSNLVTSVMVFWGAVTCPRLTSLNWEWVLAVKTWGIIQRHLNSPCLQHHLQLAPCRMRTWMTSRWGLPSVKTSISVVWMDCKFLLVL